MVCQNKEPPRGLSREPDLNSSSRSWLLPQPDLSIGSGHFFLLIIATPVFGTFLSPRIFLASYFGTLSRNYRFTERQDCLKRSWTFGTKADSSSIFQSGPELSQHFVFWIIR